MKSFLTYLGTIIIYSAFTCQLFLGNKLFVKATSADLLQSPTCSYVTTYHEYPEGFGEGSITWTFSTTLPYSQFVFQNSELSFQMNSTSSYLNRITSLSSMSYLITGEVKTFSIDLFVSNEEHSISLEDVLNTFSLTDVGFNEQYDNVHSLGNNPILYFAYGTLTNPTRWRTVYNNVSLNTNPTQSLPIYLGKGEISGYRLSSSKESHATLLKREEEVLPIVIWLLPNEAVKAIIDELEEGYSSKIITGKNTGTGNLMNGLIYYYEDPMFPNQIPENYFYQSLSESDYICISQGYLKMNFATEENITTIMNKANSYNYRKRISLYSNINSTIEEGVLGTLDAYTFYKAPLTVEYKIKVKIVVKDQDQEETYTIVREITSSIPSIHYEVEFEYTSANVIIQFTSSNHPILSVIEYTSLVTCNGSYSQMDIEILINNE